MQSIESRTFDSTLTARTNRFKDALKGLVGELPDDSGIPGYFEYLENQFLSYEVDDDVKHKILQANLSAKARSLMGLMTFKQLNGYELLKELFYMSFVSAPLF